MSCSENSIIDLKQPYRVESLLLDRGFIWKHFFPYLLTSSYFSSFYPILVPFLYFHVSGLLCLTSLCYVLNQSFFSIYPPSPPIFQAFVLMSSLSPHLLFLYYNLCLQLLYVPEKLSSFKAFFFHTLL